VSTTSWGAAPGHGDSAEAARLLSDVNSLRTRTGAAAHAYWLPLLLFGALIAGSVPFYTTLRSVVPPNLRRALARAVNKAVGQLVPCPTAQPCHVKAGALPPGATGHLTITVITTLGYYWQFGIPVVVVLTVAWYRWRGNRVGLRTPTTAFLIVGIVLAELVLLASLLAGQNGSSGLLTPLVHHEAAPVIVAAVLGVLAWTERSRALAVIVAVFLIVALPIGHYDGGGLAGSAGAAALSLGTLRLLGLIPALVLLVAGVVAGVRQGWAGARPGAPE
jgi:hypothetical protein